MGGENIKKNKKDQILFQYLRDKKKKKKKERKKERKKEGGSEKGGGGENSPISPPCIRACLANSATIDLSTVFSATFGREAGV